MGYATTEDSEASYLEDQTEYDDEDFETDYNSGVDHAQDLVERIALMKRSHGAAKAAKTGTQVHCPVCKRLFTKTTYHQAFCSNGTRNKSRNCKDKYWNFVDDSRRHRMVIMSGLNALESPYVDAMLTKVDQPVKDSFMFDELVAKLRKQPEEILRLIDKMIT